MMKRKSIRASSLEEILEQRNKGKRKQEKQDNSLRLAVKEGGSNETTKKPKKPTLAQQKKALGLVVEEYHIQKAVIDWAKLQRWGKRRIADYIHHSPNGGNRHVAEGAKFKRMGTRAGFPDLFLPIASSGFHGLFIEMKREGGGASDSQDEYMSLLNEQGYMIAICDSLLDAIKTIKAYLGLK